MNEELPQGCTVFGLNKVVLVHGGKARPKKEAGHPRWVGGRFTKQGNLLNYIGGFSWAATR